MRQVLAKPMSAVDASADAVSSAINAQSLFNCSIQTISTGASTGTLKVQVSNDIVDPSIPPTAPTHWSDLSGATVTINAASVGLIPLQNLCYAWIRLVYTKNNGSAGTITANFKAFGA